MIQAIIIADHNADGQADDQRMDALLGTATVDEHMQQKQQKQEEEEEADQQIIFDDNRMDHQQEKLDQEEEEVGHEQQQLLLSTDEEHLLQEGQQPTVGAIGKQQEADMAAVCFSILIFNCFSLFKHCT